MRRGAIAIVCGAMACAARAPTPSADPAPVTAIRRLDDTLDGTVFLTALRDRAASRGAAGFAVVAVEPVAEGGTVGGFVGVAEDRCLLGLAAAGTSVADVDLHAYADDGEMLGLDESPRATGAVLVCPPHPPRVYLAGRAMSGAGIVAVGAMAVAADHADSVAAAVEVRGRPGTDTGRLASWPGLEEAIRRRRAEVGASWRVSRRAALVADPTAETVLSTTIPAGRCIDALIVPNDDISGFELTVRDEAGRVVSRGGAQTRNRGVVLCSEDTSRTVVVGVRARESTGIVAIVVAISGPRAPRELVSRPDTLFLSPPRSLGEALKRRRAELGDDVDTVSPRLAVDPARGGTATLELDAGCHEVSLVAAQPLAGFYASMWTRSGLERDRIEGGARGTLFTCQAGKERLRLEVGTVGPPGAVAVLKRPLADPPSALLRAPRAGSRLVQFTRGQMPNEASVVRLVPGRRTPVSLPLEADACFEFAAALDGDPQGLELRLLGADGASLVRRRGWAVVGEPVCRKGSVRTLRLALTVDTAPTAAVVGFRRLD